ncbi:Bug family tripartite tricarboxylate transporter substrate binding protein [Pseudorhodoferax sp.]|uniref:Bug family tripartite tricarboxylate transporter substrate binding protein n=1 Tax=Pseudorhodoferax sp. TaxID=1993553 RepID=UPI002DD678BF|nr:tripartite tricarboxylate transporter substrate binding protein [Pseudorhodoferax sp.]
MQRRRFVTGLAAMAAATGRPAWAAAAYPTRPIRVIVPYAAGGVVDIQTRVLTQRLHAELNQPVVVEVKPGASGNIAAELVARAPADGYTLIVSASFMINNPLLETGLRWAPKDFVPVGRFALSPSYFVVPASSPAHSVKEFVELAKKASPAWQYADGGTGTPQTMANEVFKTVAGIPLEPVMYKGAPPVIPDLINGMVAMTVSPATVAIPHIKSGRIRALANINSRRSLQFPDVPTIAEAGYPDATALSWYGLHAPAGTPPEVIATLESAMRAATATQEVKERLVNAGGEEAFLGTADFTAFLRSDAERWEKLVRIIKK